MGYLLAAFGGALGALARWGVAEVLPREDGGWPWATLLVNLTGCLLIGVLTDAGAPVTVLGYLSASVVGGVVAVAAGIRVARRAGR